MVGRDYILAKTCYNECTCLADKEDVVMQSATDEALRPEPNLSSQEPDMVSRKKQNRQLTTGDRPRSDATILRVISVPHSLGMIAKSVGETPSNRRTW